MPLKKQTWVTLVAAGCIVGAAAVKYFSSFSLHSPPQLEASRAKAQAELSQQKNTKDVVLTVASASASLDQSKPRAPLAIDYSTFDNLYDLANRAASSNDFRLVQQGLMATQACMLALKARPTYEGMANSGASPDPIEAERKRSSALLLARCRGFFDNDYAANNELRSRLSAKIRQQNAYVIGTSVEAPTQAQLLDVIEREDWLTFTGAFDRYRPFVARAQGINQRSPNEYLFIAAWLAAGCGSGFDCGRDSLPYAINCADGGLCKGSMNNNLFGDFDQEQIAVAEGYRKAISEAFKSRDLAFFGLQPR